MPRYEVVLVAAAPKNRGREGRYQVGSALLAVACQRSFEEGFEGYVAFDAKTALARHYATRYGAKLISMRGLAHMMIESREAVALVSRCIRRQQEPAQQ